MPKKKGNKRPKGARQNRREKMQAKTHSAAPAPVETPVEDAAAIAEQVETAAPVEKKKPGRKPMTEEQKAEARKQREELKAAAANAKTTVYIQYGGTESGVDDLVAAARADYKATHKRTPISSIKVYVKPEDYTAYYVVNDAYFGKVDM